MRIDQPHPVADPGFSQRAHEANAAIAHRARLDPGLVILRPDEQGLELGPRLHALRDPPGDHAGGEELVLDVKRSLGGIDRVRERASPPRAFSVSVLHRRLGTGDADCYICESRAAHSLATDRRSDSVRGRSSAVTQRQRSRTISESARAASPSTIGLDIVKRTVWLAARIDAPAVIDVVLRRIPAPSGQIQSAGERDAIVDDDDLLVLGGAEQEPGCRD